MPLNGVSAAMRERVSQQLKIERRYGVKVLYACESGSRGWGLPRPTATTMYGFCMFTRWNGICGWSRRAMLSSCPSTTS